MNVDDFSHTPVLLNEVIDNFNIKPSGIYVDATIGGAGHSLKIAEKLTTGKIFGFDKDPDAVAIAKKRLENYNAKIFNADFKLMKQLLMENDVFNVDGVLMDLGVSSHQIDSENRGFSYKNPGPLDMRMSKKGKSAKDILNREAKEKLVYIFKNYGEERFANKIAQKIVEQREVAPILTTEDLKKIIKSSIPIKFQLRKNPFKKVFQALRIAVNDELESLQEGLSSSFSILNSKGRLLVISFHSLEDRIVKNFFKEQCKGCICEKDLPVCVCNHTAKAKMVNKKPIMPTQREISLNKRSHSAKLRILEKF